MPWSQGGCFPVLHNIILFSALFFFIISVLPNILLFSISVHGTVLLNKQMYPSLYIFASLIIFMCIPKMVPFDVNHFALIHYLSKYSPGMLQTGFVSFPWYSVLIEEINAFFLQIPLYHYSPYFLAGS